MVVSLLSGLCAGLYGVLLRKNLYFERMVHCTFCPSTLPGLISIHQTPDHMWYHLC